MMTNTFKRISDIERIKARFCSFTFNGYKKLVCLNILSMSCAFLKTFQKRRLKLNIYFLTSYKKLIDARSCISFRNQHLWYHIDDNIVFAPIRLYIDYLLNKWGHTKTQVYLRWQPPNAHRWTDFRDFFLISSYPPVDLEWVISFLSQYLILETWNEEIKIFLIHVPLPTSSALYPLQCAPLGLNMSCCRSHLYVFHKIGLIS